MGAAGGFDRPLAGPPPVAPGGASSVYSTVQQQDYTASVWLSRKEKLEHVSTPLLVSPGLRSDKGGRSGSLLWRKAVATAGDQVEELLSGGEEESGEAEGEGLGGLSWRQHQ